MPQDPIDLNSLPPLQFGNATPTDESFAAQQVQRRAFEMGQNVPRQAPRAVASEFNALRGGMYPGEAETLDPLLSGINQRVMEGGMLQSTPEELDALKRYRTLGGSGRVAASAIGQVGGSLANAADTLLNLVPGGNSKAFFGDLSGDERFAAVREAAQGLFSDMQPGDERLLRELAGKSELKRRYGMPSELEEGEAERLAENWGTTVGDLAGMLLVAASGPGAAGGAAGRAVGGGILGNMVGGATTFGLTEGLRHQDETEALKGAAFGGAFGTAQGLMAKGAESALAKGSKSRILEGVARGASAADILKNPLRFGGAVGAETAALEAGAMASGGGLPNAERLSAEGLLSIPFVMMKGRRPGTPGAGGGTAGAAGAAPGGGPIPGSGGGAGGAAPRGGPGKGKATVGQRPRQAVGGRQKTTINAQGRVVPTGQAATGPAAIAGPRPAPAKFTRAVQSNLPRELAEEMAAQERFYLREGGSRRPTDREVAEYEAVMGMTPRQRANLGGKAPILFPRKASTGAAPEQPKIDRAGLYSPAEAKRVLTTMQNELAARSSQFMTRSLDRLPSQSSIGKRYMIAEKQFREGNLGEAEWRKLVHAYNRMQREALEFPRIPRQAIEAPKAVEAPKAEAPAERGIAPKLWEQINTDPRALLNRGRMKTAVENSIKAGDNPDLVAESLRAFTQLRDASRPQMTPAVEAATKASPAISKAGKKLVESYLADLAASAGKVDVSLLRQAYLRKLVGQSGARGAGTWRGASKFAPEAERREMANRALSEAEKAAPQELRDLISRNVSTAKTKAAKKLTEGLPGRARKERQTEQEMEKASAELLEIVDGVPADIPESALEQIARAFNDGGVAAARQIIENLGFAGRGPSRVRRQGEAGFLNLDFYAEAYRFARKLPSDIFQTAKAIVTALGQRFAKLGQAAKNLIARMVLSRRAAPPGGAPPAPPGSAVVPAGGIPQGPWVAVNKTQRGARRVQAELFDQQIDRIITRTKGQTVEPVAVELRSRLQEVRDREAAHEEALTPFIGRALRANKGWAGRQMEKIVLRNGDAGWNGFQAAIEKNVPPLGAKHQKAMDRIDEALFATYEYGRNVVGMTRQGMRLPPGKLGGILPRIGSPESLSFWARGANNAEVKELRDWLVANNPKGTPVDAWIQRRVDFAQQKSSGDFASEREVMMEFERTVPNVPGYWKQTPLFIEDPVSYLMQYGRMNAARFAFEQTFGDIRKPGRLSLEEYRKAWDQHGGDKELFEETMRAAQGMNVFLDPMSRWIEGGSGLQRGLRGISSVYKGASFSGSFVAEAVEMPFNYGVSMFGPKAFAKTGWDLAGKKLQKLWAWSRNDQAALDAAKDLNKTFAEAMRGEGDWRVPIAGRGLGHWLEDAGHLFNNVILTPKRAVEGFSNELVRNAAGEWRKKLKAGKGTETDIELLQAMHGYSRAEAIKIANGQGEDFQYRAVENRSPGILLAGDSSTLSRNYAMSSPLARRVFLTTDYAQVQMANGYRLLRNLKDAHARSVHSDLLTYSKNFARAAMPGLKYAGWKGAQGLGFMAVMAMLRGEGTDILDLNESAFWNRAASNPLGFLAQAFVYGGILGPIGSAASYLTGADDMVSAAVYSTPPAAVIKKVSDFFGGSGPYHGLDWDESLDKFLSERLPIGRLTTQTLALAGLSRTDPKQAVAEAALRDWRKKNGFVSNLDDDPEDTEFRRHMRRAVAAIGRGEKPREHIQAAAKAQGTKAVARSLQARRLLVRGKSIPQHRWREIADYIGEENFQRILRHDRLLDAWADAVR